MYRKNAVWPIVPLTYLFAALAVCAVRSACFADESITITFSAGEKRVFKGLGGSFQDDAGRYPSLSEDTRMALAEMVWKGCDFRVLRLWVGFEYDVEGETFARRYKPYIDDVKKVQPNLILLFAPCAPGNNPRVSDMQGYANFFCDMMKNLKDNHGIEINVTGICNEPHVSGRLRDDQLAPMVKLFRQGLDSRGLNDVQVIAPEDNMDNTNRWQVIANDAGAMQALSGFALHSYNTCSNMWTFNKLRETGKDGWQTESSGFAVNIAARILSDLNLGINYWVHFFAYLDRGEGDDGGATLTKDTRICWYNRDDTYGAFEKYYYVKEISRALGVGAVMRHGATDRSDGKQKNMENTYGPKPPICAAAGLNPDGTWGIAVVNQSDDLNVYGVPQNVHDWIMAHARPYPATTFDVTIVVDELKGRGDVEMAASVVLRDGTVEDRGAVLVKDGALMFDDLPAAAMLALRPPGAGPVSTTAEAPRSPSPASASLRVTVAADRTVAVTFEIPQASGRVHARIDVYDLRGKTVANLLDSPMPTGSHRLVWDAKGRNGQPISSGSYMVVLTSAQAAHSSMVELK